MAGGPKERPAIVFHLNRWIRVTERDLFVLGNDDHTR